MIALGVDCGGTSSRWVLINDRYEPLARGDLPAISGNSFSREDFPADWQSFLTQLVAVLPEKPDCAVLASTGVHPGSRAMERLDGALARALSLSATSVEATSDMPVAYRSIFNPGEGILVYAGTGSVVHHVDASGASHQVGGYGEYIDDAGGGFWIGQQGLRHALRWNDIGRKSILSEEIFAQLGVHTWPHVWQYVYRSRQIRGAIAVLTNAVARAAEKEDQFAIDILKNAGYELAIMTQLLSEVVEVHKIGLLGGALEIPLLRQALKSHLPDDLEYVDKAIEPVEAAARWALTLLD